MWYPGFGGDKPWIAKLSGDRFDHRWTRETCCVRLAPKWLSSKTLLNPITRTALAAFAWRHRHEILRWGRTLYDQVIGRSETSPARAVRTGQVLYAIAADHRLRDAKQLKKVTMVG